jgi:hypothetical protein
MDTPISRASGEPYISPVTGELVNRAVMPPERELADPWTGVQLAVEPGLSSQVLLTPTVGNVDLHPDGRRFAVVKTEDSPAVVQY